MRAPNELLYDSEASLRLVDNALVELQEQSTALAREAREVLTEVIDQPGGLTTLSRTLFRAYAETAALLTRIRETQGVLERTSVERLSQMNDKLREVSSATEVAATDILDGLDRAVAMVDDLDAAEADGEGAGPERRAELRGALRDELFGVMGHLQFQDITTQQLNFASSVIGEIEQRLGHLVRCFAPFALEPHPEQAAAAAAATPAHFDPLATTTDARDRQAVADEIFTRKAS